MWMTMDEIAEYLKVSKETIYKMAQKGQLPGSKLGNQWRFNRQVVDEFLKAHSNINNPDDGSSPDSVIDNKEVANG
jgi:PTS system nitrogen regulatory IIA component